MIKRMSEASILLFISIWGIGVEKYEEGHK